MQDNDFTHLGWVPCLNGHLDFGLMRPGIQGGFTNNTLDLKTSCINFAYAGNADSHARKIILQSKVDWRDKKPAEEYDGLYRIIVMAKVRTADNMDERKLTGAIYIYRPAIFEQTSANKSIPWLKIIHESNNSLLAWKEKKLHENWPATQQRLNKLYTELEKELNRRSKEQNHFWKLGFEIESNGLLSIENRTILSKGFTESEAYIIARQAYYYLKYSLHHHKHHDQQADSLTTLIPIKNQHDHLKIICQLKRELTHIKRTLQNTDIVAIDEAQGILSYANSFLATLEEGKKLPIEIIMREREYLHAQASSFEAKQNYNQHTAELMAYERNAVTVWFGWLLAVIAIITAFLINDVHILEEETILPPNKFFTLSLILVAALIFLYRKIVGYRQRLKLRDRTFFKVVRKKQELPRNVFKSRPAIFFGLIKEDIKRLFNKK